MPEVVADPQGEVAKTFQNLGVCVVQQCAKIRQQGNLSSAISLTAYYKTNFISINFIFLDILFNQIVKSYIRNTLLHFKTAYCYVNFKIKLHVQVLLMQDGREKLGFVMGIWKTNLGFR